MGAGPLRSWLQFVLPLLVLAAGLVVRALDPPILEALRHKVFDTYQQIEPRPYRPLPVVVTDIDDESLQHYGQWPWPRTLVARLVQQLQDAGAAVVAFDIVFAEPDRMNPSGVAESLVGLDEATKEKLRRLPSNDKVLARSAQGAHPRRHHPGDRCVRS